MNLFAKNTTTPTSGSIFGKDATSSLFPKTSATSLTSNSTTSTNSLNTTPTTKPAPDITTMGAKYEPKTLPGGTYKCVSIMADPRFKGYTPLELRVYDYIKKDMIQKLPPQPEKPAAPATSALPSLTGGLFGSSNTNKEQNKPATTFGAVQDHGEAIKINWSSATFPTEPTYKVESAAQYFQINPKTTKDLKQMDFSISRNKQLEQKENYSKLFKSIVQQTNMKCNTAPLIIDSKLLKYAIPTPPESFVESFDEDNTSIRTIPSLKDIGDTNNVYNFRIENSEFGIIDFRSAVDVSLFNIKKDVVIDERFVDVYRRKRDIPRVGEGLNTEAVITLFKVFPKDEISGKREYNNNENVISNYQKQLKEYCLSKNIIFQSYEPQKGILHFSVKNFVNGPFEFP